MTTPGSGDRTVTTAIHDREGLVEAIRQQYVLDWFGMHGWHHWMTVYETGKLLAAGLYADMRIVELFALLHDSCRHNDGIDPDHGPRAAQFIVNLDGKFFSLDDPDMARLVIACRDHTKGFVHPDPTIQVCWDADRLDLPRAGITPHPNYLGTRMAKEILKERRRGGGQR